VYVTKLEWGPIKFLIRAVNLSIMAAHVSVTWRNQIPEYEQQHQVLWPPTCLSHGATKFPIRAVKPSIMVAHVSITWHDPHRSMRTMEASYATHKHARQHANTRVRTPQYPHQPST